ncbi:excalibur calcium-binding domain-containing protein [Kribbella sp. NPDC023855]|uniref:excalibur calcium-binding domain-containing protein n=1 Tax=Kribbella sp. NPDC023855 TaxID=3154698 RepID=UPI0034027FDC
MNGERDTVTESCGTTRRGKDSGNGTLAALAGVAVGVVVVLLVWLVVLMSRQDSPQEAASAPQSTDGPVTVKTLTVTPSVKGTKKAPAPVPPKVIGDVRSLPAGLFCRDLKAKGYSYVAAIDYWRLNGQPNQMDADKNGIPCETVYPRSDIGQYWNGREVGGAAPPASGLLCRDLAARGATYAQAVAYWWYYDMPQRMDADKNGIPCETVYSVAMVNNFWFQ